MMSNLQQLRQHIRIHCSENVNLKNTRGLSFTDMDSAVEKHMQLLKKYFNEDEIVVVFFADQFSLFTNAIYENINYKINIEDFCNQLCVGNDNLQKWMLELYCEFCLFLVKTSLYFKKCERESI